jgi:Tfp pilus assembly protein FimT
MKIKNGFTFIELLIYIALMAIFIIGTIDFGWNIIYGNVKSKNYQEVTENLRFAEKRIVFEIRNASGINSVTSQSICISNSDSTRNPTRIYLSGSFLHIGWGGGSPTCASLTNDVALTTNLVNVTSLHFVNLTNGGGTTKNIQFSITVSAINPSGRSEWDRVQTFESAGEIRSN